MISSVPGSSQSNQQELWGCFQPLLDLIQRVIEAVSFCFQSIYSSFSSEKPDPQMQQPNPTSEKKGSIVNLTNPGKNPTEAPTDKQQVNLTEEELGELNKQLGDDAD